MSALSNAYNRQAKLVEQLQDRLESDIPSGKPDELRNLAVALGIALDKLSLIPTKAD